MDLIKKGAIFDMDGTLFDTERLYAKNWGVSAEFLGLTPNPNFPYAVAGTSGEGMLEVVRRYYPEIDPQVLIDECMSRTEKAVQRGIPEKPGMREILAFFRENRVKIAVASSSSRAGILSKLRRSGIAGFFEAVVSGEEVEHGKPAPDIFLKAARQLGAAPENCFVFEDSINGARAGIAAGCMTVMIPDLFPPTKDLWENCVGIYSSLWEARDRIAGMYGLSPSLNSI